ncbi:1,4-dihydroxy-2-naphthoyl-CoA thioesterase 1-like [Ipomoea triloba]|uniref:1,4-dihydroxy-2-naphthoyl-CoA thioesterase 1-like n=1 Tax=Ipomoea triloba TaxID=35885 RepID=UPI00125D9022|nr:1,4-dihydroxy-2-naphthoyl-CoA thioesterase 1-like [Ipomoea triloba]
MDSSSSSSSKSKTETLDRTLHAVGFEIGELTPSKVTGRLPVTEKCCQPFKVLHGGVSALIAEALASMGAHMASGFRRVAGFHLGIHHLKSARIGDLVVAEATPVNVGNTVHVWEVKLWKVDPSDEDNKRVMISSSRVTLLVMAVPEHAKDADINLKKFAKL